jgi:hypothetical protein
VDEPRAAAVVSALRERGVVAHVQRSGVHQFGVRIVVPDGREAVWDIAGDSGLEATVHRDGVLVGYVPMIPGSEDFGEDEVVRAIAAADYGPD